MRPQFKPLLDNVIRHDLTTLAGALSFTAVFSFAPLLVALTWFFAWLSPGTEIDITRHISQLASPAVAQSARETLNAADRINISNGLGFLALLVTLFSASAVFGQLQFSLNHIWDVDHTAQKLGIWRWLIKRLSAMGLVLGLGFLLVLSLVLETLLAAVVGTDGTLQVALAQVVAGLGYAVFFALLYRWLPDVRLQWRQVWSGAVVSAVLFVIGKLLLDLYFAKSDPTRIFGAAGAAVAVLIWVYYASLIFFVGAEITHWLSPLVVGTSKEVAEATGNVAVALPLDEPIGAGVGAMAASLGEASAKGSAPVSLGGSVPTVPVDVGDRSKRHVAYAAGVVGAMFALTIRALMAKPVKAALVSVPAAAPTMPVVTGPVTASL
jgi:membrane protein